MNVRLDSSAVCFICGRKITGWRIRWHGGCGGDYHDHIDLHRDCADFLAAALKRDVLEFTLGPAVAELWYRKHGGQRKAALRQKDNNVQPDGEVVRAILQKFEEMMTPPPDESETP